MLQTATNPGGLRIEVFDAIRKNVFADRSQFFKDLSAPFYGVNRANAKVSQGLRDSFWLQGVQAGHKAVYDCIKLFSETDFTEDLKKIDVSTLIIHGDDDQIVPIAPSAILSSRLIKNVRLEIYKGAPHRLCPTLKDTVNADLLSIFWGALIASYAGADPRDIEYSDGAANMPASRVFIGLLTRRRAFGWREGTQRGSAGPGFITRASAPIRKSGRTSLPCG